MIPFVEIAEHIIDLPKAELEEMTALITQIVSANKRLGEKWPFLETFWTLPIREQQYHIDNILARWDVTEECESTSEVGDVFNSPYDQYKDRNGQTFVIVRKITEEEEDYDFETLPVYIIRFQDGEEITAYPEEIT